MEYLNKLNNKAVDLVIGNRHTKAVQKFHEALVHMREIMSDFPQNPSPPSYMQPRHNKATRHHIVVPYNDEANTGKREDMFLYQNVLVLEEAKDLHPSTYAIYCAVTLFNVGILYHIEGVSKGRMRLMDKAHQMYQASLHFLSGQDLWNDTVFLVSLAAQNNLAHIELEKGMVDVANQRLARAFALLQSVKSRALAILSDTELHGFLLNWTLQGKICSAAAA